MLHGRCFRFALSLIPAATLLCTAQPQQSVAEAARRTREQKKNSKPAKVITEDELDRNRARPGEAVNVIGSEPKPETQARTSSGASAPAASAEKARGNKPGTDREAAKLTEQMAQVKEQVASAQRDLDLLQRQLALDSEAFYSQTDFARDTSGQAKLDNEKQQIHDKQQDLDNLKGQLAALQEELARIKPESPEAARPPAPASPSGPR